MWRRPSSISRYNLIIDSSLLVVHLNTQRDYLATYITTSLHVKSLTRHAAFSALEQLGRVKAIRLHRALQAGASAHGNSHVVGSDRRFRPSRGLRPPSFFDCRRILELDATESTERESSSGQQR